MGVLLVKNNLTAVDAIHYRLSKRLTEEPQRIAEARSNGIKVVGYFCPYVPEELILAAGMIPIRLAFGGEATVATAGESCLKSYSCPYARSCIGYRIEGNNEYYKLVDALCVAQTCENMQQVAEYWQKLYGIPVFTIGLPHTHDAYRSRPQALKYFKNELALLRQRLAELASKSISTNDIEKAIRLCNAVREAQRQLFEYTKEDDSNIEWYDTIDIVQTGYVLDRCYYLDELRKLIKDLAKLPRQTNNDKRVRLMIAGSVLGTGDRKLMDIVREAGGNVVADVVCTGTVFARKNVNVFGIVGSPIDALAERYLYNIPCPCMTDLTKRLNRMAKIARDYKVSGAIYYSLKYCDTWRSEFNPIKDYLGKELAVPTLLIESDYSSSDIGSIRTKVEAFIEMLGVTK
jgi:benzoyl-CoA reductase/2-hydroxyglutaryl-CoA dehydratase subunit BcrC/BadD/HgdB